MSKFKTITSEDWRRSIAYRRMRPNAIRLAIQQQFTAARAGALAPYDRGLSGQTGEQPALARGNHHPVPSATSPRMGRSWCNDAEPAATAASTARRDARQVQSQPQQPC